VRRGVPRTKTQTLSTAQSKALGPELILGRPAAAPARSAQQKPRPDAYFSGRCTPLRLPLNALERSSITWGDTAIDLAALASASAYQREQW